MRTGIHEIREIHRKQLDAEKRYLETSLSSQRRSSESDQQSPLSPLSPLSPTSPSAIMSRFSMSAFNLKEIAPRDPETVKETDNAVLKSFFGTANMRKLNAVMKQTVGPEDGERPTVQRKSQSTDRLDVHVPPIPEKKNRAKVHQISLSPKTSRVHASTPDMSSLKRTDQPVSNVCSEMQQLRMKLRNTANQTVAEIEEKFSPKFNRLTLGPTIDLPLDNASSGSHSHQGSLDSSTSNVPILRQLQSSSQHNRQHSLPLSVAAQTQPHSTAVPTHPKLSPPSNSMGPSSRSPTPPHQLSHARQGSHGSSNLSHLITTYYQNQPYEVPLSTNFHRSSQGQPQHKHSASNPAPDATSAGLYRKPPPPPVSRRYSPKSQSDVRVGDMYTSEQTKYVYGGRETAAVHNHSNLGGNRFFSSNPNLLSSGMQESTHYSTAVIKKRRSSGKMNVPPVSEAQTQHPNGNSAVPFGHTYEPQSYDQHRSTGYVQPSSNMGHKPVSRGSNRSYSVKSHTSTQNYLHQGVPVPSSEINFQQAPEQIRPYMSTGELRASMKFQYVPFAEQRKITASGRGRPRQDEHEHTWL